MNAVKKYTIGIVIGVIIGLWMGVNIGKDRPIWSNPFAEPSISQKAKDAASGAWQDAKDAARESLKD